MGITNSPRGKNTVHMQLENRSTLLKLLRQNEHICRKDLAEMSGLTGAAVTNLIRDLVTAGLVSEGKWVDKNATRGRNAVPLAINYNKFLIIGAGFRRGRLICAVSDLNGHLLDKQKILLEFDETVETVLETLKSTIRGYINKYNATGKFIGLGLAFPGPINLEKGEISYLTNLPGWKNIPIKKYFENEFGLPVILDDNANATAIAEKWFGCGKNYQNLISILVSKGVGAGVILNGRIYHGAFGFAGEVGHVSINYEGPQCECGNRGCLELYCSTLALLKKAQSIYGAENILGFAELKERVLSGDQALTELIKESGSYLGFAIVNLVNSFNPELVVINGEMLEFGELWLKSVKQTVLERLSPAVYKQLKIKYTSLDDDPILLGTIAMVCDYVFEYPELKLFI